MTNNTEAVQDRRTWGKRLLYEKLACDLDRPIVAG
jgi:hypothetical protein